MGSIIDFSSLTLNTEEARDVSEVVFEATFEGKILNQVHAIQTGIEMDRFIPFLGGYGLVGKADPGGCDVNAISATIPTSQKTWGPKLISGRLTHCQADIPDLLKFWKKAAKAAGNKAVK